MAITVTASSPGNKGWIVNGVSADASGCEELVAAPGAGISLYLDDLVINSGAALTVTIGAGETAGAVTTVLIGPVSIAANSSLAINFSAKGGLKLTANTALVVDASGAGAVCIVAQGRTR